MVSQYIRNAGTVADPATISWNSDAPSIPAKLIKEFPICMIQGRSGTGKTQLTTIAHSLHYGNRAGFCNTASLNRG